MNKKFDVRVGRAEQIPSLLVVTASLRDTGWAGGDSLLPNNYPHQLDTFCPRTQRAANCFFRDVEPLLSDIML